MFRPKFIRPSSEHLLAYRLQQWKAQGILSVFGEQQHLVSVSITSLSVVLCLHKPVTKNNSVLSTQANSRQDKPVTKNNSVLSTQANSRQDKPVTKNNSVLSTQANSRHDKPPAPSTAVFYTHNYETCWRFSWFLAETCRPCRLRLD